MAMTMTTSTSTTPTTAVPAIRASCSRQLSFSGGENTRSGESDHPRGPCTSLVEELWFPRTVWQVGEDKGEPGWGSTGVFKLLSTGRAPL